MERKRNAAEPSKDPQQPEPGASARLGLRLYLAGGAPNSVIAEANLRAWLELIPPDSYDLELIDCAAEPKRALSEGVIVTPMLVKYQPAPVQKIIGALTDSRQLASIIGTRNE